MLRGVATVSIYADDLDAARNWYAACLGIAAYFERPGYCEFRIGDYQHELGIIDRRYAPRGDADSPGGADIYWHVDDLAAAIDHALSRGATEHLPVIDRGSCFITASLVDPFCNILGLMRNPHYLEVLEAGGRAQPAAHCAPLDRASEVDRG